MDILNEVWVWIVSIFGGISIAGIVSAIIYGCLKGAFSKVVNKINIEKISEDTTEKAVEKVKKVSFNQTIQPVVESELKKITESANSYIKAELDEVQTQYKKLLYVIEALASYFDNSIGVSQDAKDALKQAIADAEAETGEIEPQVITVEESVEETTSEHSSTSTTSSSTTSVER